MREEILDRHYVRVRAGENGEARMVVVEGDGSVRPLSELINESDIIVNGVFQETDNPILFITKDEDSSIKPGCLVIDVSCDEGMAFHFAEPTTFSEPMFRIGTGDYYVVDHTPSYLWDSASRSIPAAAIVHLPTVLAGRSNWQQSETIRRAINGKQDYLWRAVDRVGAAVYAHLQAKRDGAMAKWLFPPGGVNVPAPCLHLHA